MYFLFIFIFLFEIFTIDLSFHFHSALLRQSNKNWRAYFFVTDQVPFENRLRRILSSYADRRLVYVTLGYEFRPAVRIYPVGLSVC